MISLIHYNEFAENMGFPSIKDAFEEKAYDGQSDIVKYLNNGKVTMTSTGYATDIVTGQTIKKPKTFMNDGKYSWTSTLAYYVENYNMRLPKEFEDYVLNKR